MLTSRPGSIRGGYFFCPASNGVLRAFAVGRYWDTTANATRCARRFSRVCGGVMVWCVCAVCGRPAFPGLIMAAWPLPGPGDMAAPQIVLTGPSTLWRRGGIIPGETVRAVRLRAWLGKGGGVGQAAVRMRSIWRIRAESRCESRPVLRESR